LKSKKIASTQAQKRRKQGELLKETKQLNTEVLYIKLGSIANFNANQDS